MKRKLSTSWNEIFDIIVIGSGFAGLSAAIEAAQAGCSVIVLEKRDFYGGNSWISGGVLAAVDIEMQRHYNIQDSTQQMFDDMMTAGRGINDPELVRLVCSQSYATLQWLKQDFGIQFMDRIDQFGGHSVARCHSVMEIQGRNIINPLVKRTKQLGVELRLNTSLQQLYQNEQAEITGVEINTAQQGKTLNLKAKKAVILASGGFSAEIKTTETLGTSLADSTAEVLHLATEVGADLVDMEHIQLLPCASPDEQGRGVAPVFASYVVFPYGFMVDADTGQRFVNEWTDRKTRADAMQALTQAAIGITDEQGLINAGEMIHEHMDDAVIQRFDNLTALSDYYALPYRALQNTLNVYNQSVQQRYDAAFAKPITVDAKPLKAPFYALRLQPKAHSTMGGVRINSQAMVLNHQAEAIPHLYAAGEVCGGIHGVSRLACCAITECLVFGRIAGQQAALQADIKT